MSYKGSYFISKCQLVANGSSLEEDYDITRGNPSINYYESVTSPSISMTVSFIDIDQMVSQEGITGGEMIDLEVIIPDFDQKFKIESKKQKLVLNSVRDVVTSTNKQTATLEFVSDESLVNETCRVNKKFTGNVTQIVKELLQTEPKGIQTKKEIKSDDAVNKYSFVGNLKRPFETIQWLCPKAQASSRNFGFLFFENRDGYHFKSVENLLKQDPEFLYQKPDRPTETDLRIIESRLNQSNDVGMNARMGMYSNKTIYIDLQNEAHEVIDFNVSEFKSKKPLKVIDTLKDKPTRMMFRILDQGALQSGAAKKEVEKRNELAVYQNLSYIRNNLLFSQSLNISVPINPELRAGQVIEVQFPLKSETKKDTTDRFGKEKDNDISGKYLIAELRHVMGDGKSSTQLNLIRDLFTA
tara:strand:+ start:251 stop:1486 length:1236 start_codon:yes stop_codon:yes gene_type:complete